MNSLIRVKDRFSCNWFAPPDAVRWWNDACRQHALATAKKDADYLRGHHIPEDDFLRLSPVTDTVADIMSAMTGEVYECVNRADLIED